ncbi:MAG: hypothetical protein ACE5ID_10155, partial [Acidobacteriota bacterium]
PKFLRLALEKFRDEERIAFRRIAFLPDEKRLQTVSEVLEESMLRRGIDLVVSTNAIHLYYNLADTVKSWRDLLGARGRFHVQSGNILNPKAGQDEWIIDQTVETIHQAAMEICRSDSRFAPYREVLDDPVRMAAYDKLRRKYFLPPRPLDHYLAILEEAGFSDLTTSTASIPAKVAEWRDFLRVYLEGPLGWVGGTAKIEGYPPTPRAVKHRELLLDLAMARVFGSQQTFKACWTYINGQRGPGAA